MRAAETQWTLSDFRPGLSPRALGITALIAGVVAFGAVAIGSSSWILLGAALTVWSLCGWAIYFRPNPGTRLRAALGTVMFLSAAVAALLTLSGLYLLALGPSWIL